MDHTIHIGMETQDEYDKRIAEQQRRHLASIGTGSQPAEPCAHHSCPECLGTGVKHDGSTCIHMLACFCPRCSPRF